MFPMLDTIIDRVRPIIWLLPQGTVEFASLPATLFGLFLLIKMVERVKAAVRRRVIRDLEKCERDSAAANRYSPEEDEQARSAIEQEAIEETEWLSELYEEEVEEKAEGLADISKNYDKLIKAYEEKIERNARLTKEQEERAEWLAGLIEGHPEDNFTPHLMIIGLAMAWFVMPWTQPLILFVGCMLWLVYRHHTGTMITSTMVYSGVAYLVAMIVWDTLTFDRSGGVSLWAYAGGLMIATVIIGIACDCALWTAREIWKTLRFDPHERKTIR